MNSTAAASKRPRVLSERPSSFSALNSCRTPPPPSTKPVQIPSVLVVAGSGGGVEEEEDDDDDDVFLSCSSSEGRRRGHRRDSKRRGHLRQAEGKENHEKTLFPSLTSNASSTSRSPMRSLCVSRTPDRRRILREGLGDLGGGGGLRCESPCKSESAATRRASKDSRRKQQQHQKVKLLGRGSFGSVVLGEWQGQRVAVKLISGEQIGCDRRCRTESAASEANAVGIVHPNVVRVHGIFGRDEEEEEESSSPSSCMVVMEYVGQSNLQRVLDTMPERMDKDFLHRCFTDVARALAFVHSRGLLHLDLKPSNVFVTSRGECKLGDFGCSRRAGEENGMLLLVGTSGYQAPELLSSSGRSASDRCDVYSYGVLLWQVLHSGEAPFAGAHPHAVIYQVVKMGKRPTSSSRRLIPPSSAAFRFYSSLYEECWAQEAERRPTMATVLRRLERRSQSSHLKIEEQSSDVCSGKRRKSSSIRM